MCCPAPVILSIFVGIFMMLWWIPSGTATTDYETSVRQEGVIATEHIRVWRVDGDDLVSGNIVHASVEKAQGVVSVRWIVLVTS